MFWSKKGRVVIDFALVTIRVDGREQPCMEAKLALRHKLPHIWDWLKVANNTGSDNIDGHEVQIWNYTVQILILHYLISFPPFFPYQIKLLPACHIPILHFFLFQATGVSMAGYIERDDTPYILKYMIGGNFTQLTFLGFRLEKPHDNHSFQIPEECESGNNIAQGSPGFFTDLFRFKFWN